MEVWKDIEGHEGSYQVSNKGRVRSLDRVVDRGVKGKIFLHGKVLKPYICGGGYCYVDIGRKNFRVHRLVAQAFIENPSCSNEVNHIDENKMNNAVENLEWCTRSENMKYGTCRKRGSKNTDWKKLSNSKSMPILQFDLNGNLLKEYHSMKDAEKETGVRNGNISKCCNGIAKTAGGFVWKKKGEIYETA